MSRARNSGSRTGVALRGWLGWETGRKMTCPPCQADPELGVKGGAQPLPGGPCLWEQSSGLLKRRRGAGPRRLALPVPRGWSRTGDGAETTLSGRRRASCGFIVGRVRGPGGRLCPFTPPPAALRMKASVSYECIPLLEGSRSLHNQALPSPAQLLAGHRLALDQSSHVLTMPGAKLRNRNRPSLAPGPRGRPPRQR